MNLPAEDVDRLGERWMRLVWRKPAVDVAERTRRRVTIHLLPFLFFLYILAYVDRINVSVAKLQMVKPLELGGLGFDNKIIGLGIGMFFWTYWILEIPSTVSVVKWGARWVFVRILILWGLCAAAAGLIGLPIAGKIFGWWPLLPTDWPVLGSAFAWLNALRDDPKHQFYCLRLLLGFFEGGFFPSVVVYLSLWFRPQDRAKAMSCFMIGMPLANALGAPLSGLLLKANWLGLMGWRWVFIVEGALPILAGFATLFLLPARPKDARWLSTEERAWLEGELQREHELLSTQRHWTIVHHLGMVLLLTAVYFGQNVASYGLGGFMPSMIQSHTGVSDDTAALLTALPYLMGFLAMLINARHSDKTSERVWHVSISMLLLGGGILLAALAENWGATALLVYIFCVGPFIYAHMPAFWSIPTLFLGSTAAASAIGFINMTGNLGGSLGTTIVGYARDNSENFRLGLLLIAPFPIASALIVLIVAYVRRRKPAKD
ncbi:MAG TPA: MFS transporter [Pirellulales bacterium]|nr:MFS transporter [Pirellulales bacterium]